MSSDGGAVWTQIDSWFSDGGSCLVHPDSTNIVITGGAGPSYSFCLSVSRDSGRNWTRFDLSGSTYGTCQAIAVAPGQPAKIYAGGAVGSAGAVYVSTDYGRNWTRTTGSLRDTVYSLAVHPTNPATLLAACPSGIFRSTNSGASWTDLSAGTGFKAVLFYQGSPDTILAAGRSGVCISTDAGARWTRLQAGLEGIPVLSLALADRDGDFLIAGTDGHSCYGWSFNVGISADPQILPDASGLKVFPNPCRGKLQIDLPFTATCCIDIFDVTGRNVLHTSILPSESRNRLFLGFLPTGVYQLQLKTGTRTISHRLVISPD
ncbi:MAG: T9SS type A sorting domain-containing protein [candidate division WOR-3 bacterium]